MTWGEMKTQIRDLGFDDDASMAEYSSIVINASNRAVNTILKTIVETYEGYFKNILSTYDSDGNYITEWVVPTLVPITADTPDSFVINLPDKVIDLVPVLASYWVWLDDDERKAVMYYNMYETVLGGITADINMPRKYTFTGGVYFG